MNPSRLGGTFLLTLGFLLVCTAGTAFADGGTLYVWPDSGIYSIGDTFQVQVLADSGGQPINAAEADLTFNPEALEVESISTDGSILTTWPAAPHFSNLEGTIGFSGVASQDFTGTGGLLITITFKALSDMQSDARLAAGAILAADNLESNIITTMKSGVFNIEAQEGNPAVIAAANSSSGASGTDAGSDATGTVDDSFGGLDSTSTPAAPIPSIAAPVLSGYQNQISAGDRIIVSGTAPASSTVSVYLQKGNDTAERTDMTTDPDGSFTYVSDTEAQTGIYQLWAITLGENGDQSDPSNEIEITASPSAAAASAVFVSTLISGIMPLLALLVFAALGAGYIFHRHRIEKLKLAQQKSGS